MAFVRAKIQMGVPIWFALWTVVQWNILGEMRQSELDMRNGYRLERIPHRTENTYGCLTECPVSVLVW